MTNGNRAIQIWLVALFGVMFWLLLVVQANAASVTKTISSAPPTAGTWTSSISPAFHNPEGHCNVSVQGASWSATVTLQRSFDGGTTWYDVTTFTSNTERAFVDSEEGVLYRIGVKNGAYSSGSVAVRLSK